MKSTRSWAFLIVLELLALCTCVLVLAGLVAALGLPGAGSPDVASEPTASPTLDISPSRLPTYTPAPSPFPAATFTRVIPLQSTNGNVVPAPYRSATATAAPSALYNIVVPTPTAPAMAYPITFSSHLKIVTYPVAGRSEQTLSQSLNAQAMSDPNDPDGKFYAKTDWFLSAAWNYQPTSRGCEVGDGSVTLAMTMTLPALSSSVGMPTDLLSHWTTFISNTITHESGHVKLSEQGARTYQHDLGNFQPASDCTAIQPQLSGLFNRASAAIRKANVDYDAQTNHGESQGAVFPGD